MKYILVNPKKLNIDFTEEMNQNGFTIPLHIELFRKELSPIESIIYNDVLRHAINARDRLDSKKLCLREVSIFEYFVNPQPWLIATGYLMWQGIQQGLAWDAVKVIVLNALEKMRMRNVAPPIAKVKERKKGETKIGFVWEKYGTDGRKMYHMFLGIKRKYDQLSEEERLSVTNSIVPEPEKNE